MSQSRPRMKWPRAGTTLRYILLCLMILYTVAALVFIGAALWTLTVV